MTKSYSDAYKAAGVDVTAGYKAVELMKKHVSRTTTSGVLDSIGGFGGLFAPDMTGMKKPVLVSGTDGVGTKLKLAMLLDQHDTVGIDCVAMCVNDVVCAGAQPLFFLDYIACGKNKPEKIAEIVKGVADGCVESGCALIGGETAEMPGFYPEDEYDLAGFTVGIVDEEKILDEEVAEAEKNEEQEVVEAEETVSSEDKAKKAKKSKAKKSVKKSVKKDSKLSGFRAELKKVIWPKGRQLFENTVVVVSMVIVVSVLIFVLDLTFRGMKDFEVKQLNKVITSNTTNSTSMTETNTTSNTTATTNGTNANS